MSPQIATVSPAMRPLARRMVSASSSAWVGCSCAPSPALITEQSTFCASSSTAPAAWWRTTRMSGRMALSVIAVSISVSPFCTEEVDDVHVHDVGAQPLAGELEGALRAGRGLEEQVDQRAPAQDVALLVDLAVVLGGLVGEVEQGIDLAAPKGPRRSADGGGRRRPWLMGLVIKGGPIRRLPQARKRRRGRRARAWRAVGLQRVDRLALPKLCE